MQCGMGGLVYSGASQSCDLDGKDEAEGGQVIARAALLACAATAITAAAPSALAPPTLAVRLERAGAKTVVNELDATGQFDTVIEQIGHGSAAWVALAPRLAPGADGANAEGLGIALARALPINPAAVLRASTDWEGPVGIKRVCSVPFIETTRSYNLAYTRRALAALSRVHDPDLVAKRNQCRTNLTAPWEGHTRY